jgi:cysteine desulfurase
MCHIPLNFSKIQVDFASCSAHKFHGPKGVGFAFIRKSTHLKPLILGGAQERNMRAGTENVSGIVGMEKAFELAMDNIDAYNSHISEVKKYTVEQLSQKIKGVKFGGRSAEESSLNTVLSVLLPYSDPLIGLKLDMKGIEVSQGSACSSGAVKPSSAILSILNQEERRKFTPIRISFSHETKKSDIDALVKALLEIEKEM